MTQRERILSYSAFYSIQTLNRLDNTTHTGRATFFTPIHRFKNFFHFLTYTFTSPVLYFFIGVLLIYNVVLISAVQQIDSVIRICTFFFFFLISPRNTLVDTPRIMFNHMSGHPVAQESWHMVSAITPHLPVTILSSSFGHFSLLIEDLNT